MHIRWGFVALAKTRLLAPKRRARLHGSLRGGTLADKLLATVNTVRFQRKRSPSGEMRREGFLGLATLPLVPAKIVNGLINHFGGHLFMVSLGSWITSVLQDIIRVGFRQIRRCHPFQVSAWRWKFQRLQSNAREVQAKITSTINRQLFILNFRYVET